MPELRVTTGFRGEVVDPPQSYVTELLADVAAGRDEFVIVERLADPEGLTFIQAAALPQGSLAVEFQDGSVDAHYRLEVTDPQQVADIFAWWVVEQPGWREGLPWERVELS